MSQTQRYFDRLPMLVEAGLVVLMAWLVTGWLLGPEQQSEQAMSVAETAAVSLPELADMLTVPLFGKMAQKPTQSVPAAVKQQPKPAVVTPLRLKLLGTVVSGEDSVAVVQLDGAATQKVLFIGDTIKSGSTLKTVEASAIVIEHDGRMERITMQKSATLGASVGQPAAVRTPQPRSQGMRMMSRANLQQQMQNLPKLLTEARVTPNMVNGRADGFVISDIVPGSLYQQAGLVNGDVLKKVNGQLITNPGQAMKMYQTLQNAPAIDLQITRDGQIQQLHYDIR